MWIESIPNFSEGKNSETLHALAEAARLSRVSVLGMEGDPDHNRSVLTLAGPPDRMLDALLAASRVALERIDLSRQRGVHPRMGAVDVIPLVPLGETSMEEAVALSRELGACLGQELGLPVYLYEQSASRAEHHNLAHVRGGGFNRLAQRMAEDPPDFGPPYPHPTAGAVAVGARWPLIAFNCYLSGGGLAVAKAIARGVRASGGGLAGVKALGLELKSQGAVQVSMNIVDYPKTPLPMAVERVRQAAADHGLHVTRTELVGLMPLRALFDVAEYYLGLAGIEIKDIVELSLASDAIHAVMLPEESDLGKRVRS